MENIAELFVEFFVEKLREKNIIITTRLLALLTGEKNMICKICGTELEPEGMCWNCQSALIQDDDIFPNT